MLYAVLSTDTQNRLKYHVFTVKPSFTVKMIDCMHQTGPAGRKLEKLRMSHTCSTIIKSLTVSALRHKWELFFTKPGVKTNRQSCCDMLLSQQILDAMMHVIDGKFIFHQNEALMHIAFNTVQLLRCKTFVFISGLWPQDGPELNSSDDEI